MIGSTLDIRGSVGTLTNAGSINNITATKNGTIGAFSNSGTIGHVYIDTDDRKVTTFENKSGGVIQHGMQLGNLFNGKTAIDTFTNKGTIRNDGGRISGNTLMIRGKVKDFTNASGGIISGSRTGVQVWGGEIEEFKNTGTIAGNLIGIIIEPTNLALDHANLRRGAIKNFTNDGVITGNFGLAIVGSRGEKAAGLSIETLTNSGVIEGTGNHGIYFFEEDAGSYGSAGTIKNTGTIKGASDGIHIANSTSAMTLNKLISTSGSIIGTSGVGILAVGSGKAFKKGFSFCSL